MALIAVHKVDVAQMENLKANPESWGYNKEDNKESIRVGNIGYFRDLTNFADLRENCSIMTAIIDKMQQADKGDLNELSQIFDSCKEDILQNFKDLEA